MDDEIEDEERTNVERDADWVVLDDVENPRESSSASPSPLFKTFAEVATADPAKVQ